MLRRAGWGLVIAAVAMGVAALLEWRRLDAYRREFCRWV